MNSWNKAQAMVSAETLRRIKESGRDPAEFCREALQAKITQTGEAQGVPAKPAWKGRKRSNHEPTET